MSEIDVEAEIENMFATTDDENGTAVKNEPPIEVKNEPRPDSGLRRSSRAPKKKSYREEFEYEESQVCSKIHDLPSDQCQAPNLDLLLPPSHTVSLSLMFINFDI